MSVPPVDPLPDIQVETGALRDGARTLRDQARLLDERLGDAESSWRGLREAYRHEGTQERVWSGLDLLEAPVDSWRESLTRGADLTADFAAAADILIFRHASLELRRVGVDAQRAAAIASNDPVQIAAATSAVLAFNGEVADLTADWHREQEQYAAGLRGVSGGEDDALPADAGAGSGAGLDWDGLRNALDGAMRADDPEFRRAAAEAILAEVKGMDKEQFLDWVRANPHSAEVLLHSSALLTLFESDPGLAVDLLDSTIPASADPSSAEGRLLAAIDSHPDPNSDVDATDRIRSVWTELSEEERSQLLLMYPRQLGELYGVSENDRAAVNVVNVVGLQEQTRAALDAHEGTRPGEFVLPEGIDPVAPGAAAARAQARAAHDARVRAWEDEKERLEIVESGLTQAIEGYRGHYAQNDRAVSEVEPGEASHIDYRVLNVSPNGYGQITTMRGEFTDSTQTVVAFTPGTFTDISSVNRYTNTVAAIGDGRADTVEIYWADGRFPGNSRDGAFPTVVTANMTSEYNTADAHRQSVFDHAIDASAPHASQTWIGHSAGGSKLGTAEAAGLDADRLLYMAPAGTGHGVGGPEETGSWDAAAGVDTADRATIQSRLDPIVGAQETGGLYHGESVFHTGDPDVIHHAVPLESGYTEDGEPVFASGALGHTSILDPGSTAMRNATAFAYGEPVVLEENLVAATRRQFTDDTDWDSFTATPYQEAFDR